MYSTCIILILTTITTTTTTMTTTLLFYLYYLENSFFIWGFLKCEDQQYFSISMLSYFNTKYNISETRLAAEPYLRYRLSDHTDHMMLQ